MTCEGHDVIAWRHWCIEKAFAVLGADDTAAALNLAVELIALMETGQPWRAPRRPQGEDDAPQPASIEAERRTAGNEAATQVEPLPVKMRPARLNGPESVATEPKSPRRAPEPEPTPLRSIPRMPAKTDSARPDDLSEKDQAVLMAVTILSAGDNGWPSHAQIAEASDVPRGSLNYVLERLLDKGRLARIDGKWALPEAGAA